MANDLRWVRVRTTGTRSSSLRSIAMPTSRETALASDRSLAATEGTEDLELEFPDLSEYATPLAKARILLDSAAEIEHALMLQYLYAAYSLRDINDMGLSVEQKNSISAWRGEIVRVAIEEMGHLMTVQNLLLFIKQPVNFEREDFPPRKNLYPFSMQLEPLTQKSLSKYVVAESPHDAQGIEDIVTLATDATGMRINRVGILYGMLGVVFTKLGELDTNASNNDPWFVFVRDIGHSLFEQFTDLLPDEWHLVDADFDMTSVTRQAGSEWESGQGMKVQSVSNRTECLAALKFIGVQGEGPTTASSETSHFERFLNIYRGNGHPLSFPPEGDWLPTKAVPTNPIVDSSSTAPNAISEATAVQWANLANLRYSMLLAMLQYYFTGNPANRDQFLEWCIFGAMKPLRMLSQKLVTLNRRADTMVKASIPFSLPDVVNLPGDVASQLALIRRRVSRSSVIIDALIAGGATEPVLATMKNHDDTLLTVLGIAPITPPPVDPIEPPPVASPQEAAMLKLIERKQPRAISPHPNIAAHGTTLSQLFRDKRYADILSFLKQGTAIMDPFTGKKLIEPGKPEESAFYLHISKDEGAMSGQFIEDEIVIVRDWIASLAASAPVPTEPIEPKTPPVHPPKETNSEQDMLALLKSKKIRAQVMHGAIPTPGGTSLSELFRTERYADILNFLRSSSGIVDPFTGKPLIQPGVPLESAFYLHITDGNGAMVGRFSPDEIAVVERWITSLGVKNTGTKQSPYRSKSRLVASGLDRPVCIAAPSGESGRLYVVEQGGVIKIVDSTTGSVLSTPFLRLDDIASGGEQGLLGLAFHPNYQTNRTFFVNCTNLQGATEIRSYQTKSGTSDEADPSTRKVLLTVPQPFRNHNGGWIAFGPKDGYLYIGMGDGGSSNDPQNNAQNLNSLLGKMLRIDVDRDDFPGDANRNYAIPLTNPFVSRIGARPEIWATGLRNPWRCAFDRKSGDLYIGDVGQSKREEIDFQPHSSAGGENYGWNLKEGTLATGISNAAGTAFTDPIHEYGPADGFAIIGGYVYRGTQFPAMLGVYFFGDHGGRIWSLSRGKLTQVEERTGELTQAGHSLENLSTFGEDSDGELYYATLNGDLMQLQAENLTVTDDRWNETVKVRIHPAIGVARVGNAGFVNGIPASPAQAEDFFIGPEQPYASSPPSGGYKRNGRIRRQAARFRLYAYNANDKLIGEITSDIADIAWTVELANKKASFRRFTGLATTNQLRNSHMTGADRARLEIKPGAKTLTGPNQSAAFNTGSFTDMQSGNQQTISNIYLGEIQTEESGRLIVLGGEGTSRSPLNKPIVHFANNDGWFDTISDGPVEASVKFKSTGSTFAAIPSWIICAPPKFAPSLRNVVTLRDVLFQIAVDKGWLTLPDRPSFRYDIFPILNRAVSMKWLLAAAGNNHDVINLSFPSTPSVEPAEVFRRLRSPIAGSNSPGMNMPQLFDDNNAWVRNGDGGLAFTKSMYEMLRRWSIGQFENDWAGAPPEPSTMITPDGLDQAALENCAGGGFFPGIEAGWMMRDSLSYVEPFRLDSVALKAGDITRQMAVPWQADFYKCTSTSSDTRRVGWWPQQRPDEVFTEGSTVRQAWTRGKVNSHQDMVEHWSELGFIVNNGNRYVESERNET